MRIICHKRRIIVQSIKSWKQFQYYFFFCVDLFCITIIQDDKSFNKFKLKTWRFISPHTRNTETHTQKNVIQTVLKETWIMTDIVIFWKIHCFRSLRFVYKPPRDFRINSYHGRTIIFVDYWVNICEIKSSYFIH